MAKDAKPGAAKPLTPKQERFVEQFMVDLNATQATIRAGYSAKTAGQIGFKLLKKAEINRAITDRRQELSQSSELTVERVRKLMAQRLFFDARKFWDDKGGLRSPHTLDEAEAAALESAETVRLKGRDDDVLAIETMKIKFADRTAILGLAMRHLGMFAKENGQLGAAAAQFLELREMVSQIATSRFAPVFNPPNAESHQ